jgi:hypothetical protein
MNQEPTGGRKMTEHTRIEIAAVTEDGVAKGHHAVRTVMTVFVRTVIGHDATMAVVAEKKAAVVRDHGCDWAIARVV